MTLYTTQEVCQILRISRGTLDRLRRRGEIPFTRVGGRLRWTDDQVREYLSRHQYCQTGGRA
jgi:excisionase family DNA binding protein